MSDYKRADYTSDQDVRWCPACGDYAILNTLLKILPDLGVPPHEIAVISGIGCSSRFPYYLDTYGFHSIHGRAPSIATGLKALRPELSLWLITGDGDGFSIGAGHMLHLLRRNVDLTVLCFNNEIYGLTKGQTSPTSQRGTRSKSSPMGSIEAPIRPLAAALGAGASFVARTVDTQIADLENCLRRAHAHRGTAFVEILQNCLIFNDGVHAPITDKATRADTQLHLSHGQPLSFGAAKDKGLSRAADGSLTISQDPDTWITHNEQHADPGYATRLAGLSHPEHPIPMGILRAMERPCFEDALSEQIDQARSARPNDDDLATLYTGFGSAATWDL